VSEANGSGSVAGGHIYTAAGVYTLTLTVTDEAGNTAQAVFQYVVIYDPNGGFVTGGGWINSPPGAYTPNPNLSGKATFGFVSKYQKGANVPTGQT
jgi:PKD repeat protein